MTTTYDTGRSPYTGHRYACPTYVTLDEADCTCSEFPLLHTNPWDARPSCWCGEPAEYVTPADPAVFPTTGVMRNGDPATHVCWQHVHDDRAERLPA